jgi:hypothetical protein
MDYKPFTATNGQTLTACTLAKHQTLSILAYGRATRAYNIARSYQSKYLASVPREDWHLHTALHQYNYGYLAIDKAAANRHAARLDMIRASIERAYPDYYKLRLAA